MSDGTTAANGAPLPPLPKDHLDHPEQWATGAEPATEKQKGFIAVLEKQHPESAPEGGIDTATLGKSEASEVIDKLKNGEPVEPKEGQDYAVEKQAEVTEEKAKPAGEDAKMAVDGDEEPKEPEVVQDTTKQETKQEDDKNLKRKTDDGDETTHDTSKGSGDEQTAGNDASKPSDQSDVDEQPAQKKARADAQADDQPGEAAEAKEAVGDVQETDTSKKTVDSETTDPVSDGKDNALAVEETVPGDDAHLDHPENWTTGGEPATDKQKGFLRVLESKTGEDAGDVEAMGKSEASAKIDELKSA